MLRSAQTDLPAITAYDAASIRELAAEVEIDYVALTYTCGESDVAEMRALLDGAGLQRVKILAKARPPRAAPRLGVRRVLENLEFWDARILHARALVVRSQSHVDAQPVACARMP